MRFIKSASFTVALLCSFTLCSLPAQAQGPGGQHGWYLHALSDLRLMRGYLDRLTPSERIDAESQHAIDEIDAAIHEIKAASIDDGKDIHEHEPIDAHIRPTDRFHKAREAGNAALSDLRHEEDNAFARGLQHRAIDHVQKAVDIVDHIIHRVDHTM